MTSQQHKLCCEPWPNVQDKRSASRAPFGGEVSTVNSIAIGVRIFHQKFGYGTVVSNDDGKLEIDFEKAGTKKVLESFVEPA